MVMTIEHQAIEAICKALREGWRIDLWISKEGLEDVTLRGTLIRHGEEKLLFAARMESEESGLDADQFAMFLSYHLSGLK
jgi:hypothetical protein